nr:MAG TPA: hypothetical protein [Caudoviricetes sp.]DAW67581.1 MAG TPA: hypothetical protein [Caudoviricetes sp.]
MSPFLCKITSKLWPSFGFEKWAKGWKKWVIF